MCLYRNTCCAYINLYTYYIKKIEIVEKDNDSIISLQNIFVSFYDTNPNTYNNF